MDGGKIMIKKTMDTLAGLPMTLIAGFFLLLDLIPHLCGQNEFWQNCGLWFDPAWVTVLISGIPLLYLAIWRLIHNPGISKISSALLISIAMAAAIAIQDLFAAGEVAFIMAIGALLEERTTLRAKQGLHKLMSLTPTQGRRIRDGKEEMVPAEMIQQGDLVRILPGETIPVDGVIVDGKTSVDQSIMTGESLPVDKEATEEVFCGTLNCFGAIDIQATRTGEDSSLQKLIQMVQQAEEKQAPMQRIADQAASWLVPVALLIAVAAFVTTKNVVTAVTVLVVFCPCALVLATPTAIMAAIGQASRHGVLIKSGEALEQLGKADTMTFDKTGTLTFGCLAVSDVVLLDSSIERRDFLMLAASAEAKSEHPLGKALVAKAKEEGISLLESEDFTMAAGKGIQAKVKGRVLLCGNEKWLLEHQLALDCSAKEIQDRLRSQGKATLWVAEDGCCLGIVALSDVLRPQAAEVVRQLQKMQMECILLTGDNCMTAHYFAKQAGVNEVWAELLPEEKVHRIEALRQQKRVVCMVGDGVNDAPALKSADVSVAMGSIGSDIAIEAASIALMSDDLGKLLYLKRLSKATVATIKFSITLSMMINFTAIGLSLAGLLNPTTGALVHNAGSCFVVLIAALLYDRKFD